MRCPQPREESHPASEGALQGGLCSGAPAAASESQREKAAVAHSDTHAGPSETSWEGVAHELLLGAPQRSCPTPTCRIIVQINETTHTAVGQQHPENRKPAYLAQNLF